MADFWSVNSRSNLRRMGPTFCSRESTQQSPKIDARARNENGPNMKKLERKGTKEQRNWTNIEHGERKADQLREITK